MTTVVGLGIFGPYLIILQDFQNQINLVYKGVQSFDVAHLNNLDGISSQFTKVYQQILKELNNLQKVHLPQAQLSLNSAKDQNSATIAAKLIIDIVAEISYFVKCMLAITGIITTFLAIIALIIEKIAELTAQLVLMATKAVGDFLTALGNDLLAALKQIKKDTVVWIQHEQGVIKIKNLISDMQLQSGLFQTRKTLLQSASTTQPNFQIDMLLNQYANQYNTDLGTLYEIEETTPYGPDLNIDYYTGLTFNLLLEDIPFLELT